MAKVTDLSAGSIKHLGLSPQVQAVLTDIQAELAAAYRDSFVEMVQAMQQQTSALERIQTTLRILIEHIEPKLAGQIPEALRIVGDGERPDLASTVVVADPIAKGYALSQSSLAKALGISSTDVSILCKSFKLSEDGKCAVVVRKGSKQQIVNYHPRAIDRFRELVKSPPHDLDASGKTALVRVRKRMGINGRREGG